MAFKVAFLAHAPDAEPEKHKCVIETSKYKLFVVVVNDQQQAAKVCERLVKEEGIQSVLLCPGFTHKNVAEIAETAGENVGVFVARGDGPSNRVTRAVMEREGWFSKQLSKLRSSPSTALVEASGEFSQSHIFSTQ